MSPRDEFLERLFLGELDLDSDEARSFFVDHPEAREELEELRRAEESIRRSGADRRALVEEALHTEGIPGENVVERVIEERLGASASAAPAPARRWWVALAAAAAVVLLLWRPWTAGTDTGPGPETGPTLGGPLLLREPLREAGEIVEFQWEHELEGSQYFRVFVYKTEDLLVPLAPSGDLDEPRWRPDPAEVEAWPETVRWEVHVMEGTRSVVVDSAVVQRRSSP